VILSVDEYSNLIEAKEDFELLKLSIDRIKNSDPESRFGIGDVIKEFGYSDKELEALEDEVDID